MYVYVNGDIKIQRIPSKDTHDFILNKHYAKRLPSISFAFGLFYKNKLSGVCSYGKPASRTLCIGLLGKQFEPHVYELNRLIVNEGLPKNTLSMFVSKTLKMLKKEDLAIVSFADDGVGHKGYIYQACSFIYTGKSKERTDKYMPGNKHPRHYTEEFAHLRKVRTSKHRYIYFTGKSRKLFLEELKYKTEPYPKGNNERYILGERSKTKVINKDTGGIFYE